MITQYKLSRNEIIWHIVVICTIVYTIGEAPFSWTFKVFPSTVQIAIDAIIAVIFIVDSVQYVSHIKNGFKYKKNNNKMNLEQITKLSINIVGSLPFDLICVAFGLPLWMKMFKMIRFFRLIRTFKIFSVVGNLTVIPMAVKLVIFGVSAMMAIHIISCFWTIVEPLHLKESNTVRYINSLYWAITTLSTVSYGDVTPSTNISKLFTMFIMVTGVGMYGLVIGNVAQLISEANRYKEKSREKIEDLTTFMKHYQVPRKVQLETLSYYNNMLDKRLSDNDYQIISDLPQALQEELTTYMNIKLINSLSLFKNCSKFCLKEVAMSLEKKSYSPGQFIIKTGEIGSEMFIINHGVVDVKIEDKVLTTLSDGKFFGEKALLEEATRNADIVAASYCDVYKLKKEDFLRIIARYPELLRNMEGVIQLREAA